MFTINASPGMRRGRIFLRSSGQADAWMAAPDCPPAPEDEPRDALLRGALKRRIVVGVVHFGIDPDDIVDVYLDHPDTNVGPLFACVIAPESRVERMLDESPAVVEDFCFQVAQGRTLTPSAIQAALEAWSARNYEDNSVPRFTLKPWSESPEDDSLELLLSEGFPGDAGDEELPAEHRPAAGVAQPAYEDAA